MTEEGEYVPCELALLEYSLEKGIKRKLQIFIEPPDGIPVGYSFAARQHSQKTHRIPISFREANSDYTDIFSKIKNFVNTVSL